MYFVNDPPTAKGDAIFTIPERAALDYAEPEVRIRFIEAMAVVAGDTIARVAEGEYARDVSTIRDIGIGLQESLRLTKKEEAAAFAGQYSVSAGIALIIPAREELVV